MLGGKEGRGNELTLIKNGEILEMFTGLFIYQKSKSFDLNEILSILYKIVVFMQ